VVCALKPGEAWRRRLAGLMGLVPAERPKQRQKCDRDILADHARQLRRGNRELMASAVSALRDALSTFVVAHDVRAALHREWVG